MSSATRGSNAAGELTARPNRIAAAYTAFRRLPIVPVTVVILLIVIAVFAEFVAPNDPLEGDLDDRNVPPAWTEEGSAEFLLGTDHIGRGILSRMVFGTSCRLSFRAGPR